jgi:hypothetical protein
MMAEARVHGLATGVQPMTICKPALRSSVFAAALLAGTSAQAATFVDLSMTTSTSVIARVGANTQTRTNSTPFTTSVMPNPAGAATSLASASARRTSTSTTGIQANATTTASAFFVDAGEASFDITSGASVFQTLASTTSVPVSGRADAGAYTVNYTFSIVGPKVFSLGYNLWALNLPAGAGPVMVALSGGIGSFSENLAHMGSGPGAANVGSITTMLATGTYLLSVSSSFESFAERINRPMGNTQSLATEDHFDLSIASVPEPSAWSLLIVGFGATGAAMRRRRTHLKLLLTRA